jgi:predicted heme/steroid binding protein
LGAHQAAKDLTEEIELAPHSEDKLGKMKIVGVLV